MHTIGFNVRAYAMYICISSFVYGVSTGVCYNSRFAP
jgi:hypothetical protein